MKTEHISIEFVPPTYLFDHRHGRRAVMPAVEALQLLGRSVQKLFPDTILFNHMQARFDKFLYLDHIADKTIIDIFSRIQVVDHDTIACSLSTKNRAGQAAFSRIKEHVRVNFFTRTPPTPPPSPPGTSTADRFDLTARRLYRELVPFGPAYRNLSGRVHLWPEGAAADIVAPGIDDPHWVMGSPFVLDAALHAACAWGQRYAGIIGFPVGVERRIIYHPAQAGRSYRTLIHASTECSDSKDLRFDVSICDTAGTICETAAGVCMRDVSGGKAKPPDWVVA